MSTEELLLEMWMLTFSSFVTQFLTRVEEQNFTDILKNGAKTSIQIAEIKKLAPEKVYRMLKFATSFGMFKEIEKDLWENNNGSLMVLPKIKNFNNFSDKMKFFLPNAMNSNPDNTSFEKPVLPEKSFFALMKDNPDIANVFNKGMKDFSEITMIPLLEKYDFSKCGLIADVGGGMGHLVVEILKKYPQLNGIVFDLPQVIEKDAKEYVSQSGVADRLALHSGDFLKSIPEADTIIMKNTLHNWDAEKTDIILGNVHKALKSRNGKLLIAEFVLNEVGPNSKLAAILDFLMNMMFNSKEKTASEWKTVLSKNRFEMKSVVHIFQNFSVVEATPI